MESGGFLVAKLLKLYGVERVFTLCGGHISPILTGCEQLSIEVIDVREEATAVFAAEATSRLTQSPGVAVLTAGPGLTNSITPLQNAKAAQIPLLVIGGAAPTILAGRGALQEMDQMALMKPNVKKAFRVERRRKLLPTLEEALVEAFSGTPGPVFLEIPMDLLYPREVVEEWYGKQMKGSPQGGIGRLAAWWMETKIKRLFEEDTPVEKKRLFRKVYVPEAEVMEALHFLKEAKRPLLLLGTAVALDHEHLLEVQKVLRSLRIPTYLTGMSRGLLGRKEEFLFFHRRREALKEADCVFLVGVPCDFRLNYGLSIRQGAKVVLVHTSEEELSRNRDISRLRGHQRLEIQGDPAVFLRKLGKLAQGKTLPSWEEWRETLTKRERAREEEIERKVQEERNQGLSPLWVLKVLEEMLPEEVIFIGDGGDFVGTAAYLLRPRRPLGWLDPGPFGTLGVGAGFALGAKLALPRSLPVILYGDGACGYSLIEFHTFSRYKLGVLAVVGNDGAWSQIQRDQVEILKSSVATELGQADYYKVAEALGGKGFLVEKEEDLSPALQEGLELCHRGVPVLLDCRVIRTDFRKGSISV